MDYLKQSHIKLAVVVEFRVVVDADKFMDFSWGLVTKIHLNHPKITKIRQNSLKFIKID